MKEKSVVVAHQPLPEEYERKRRELRERKANRRFWSWKEGDTAVVQIIGSEIISTRVGDHPRWAAYYLKGNIHDPTGREGAPTGEGAPFHFWTPTVLQSAFEENMVGPGSVVFIDCEGQVEGGQFGSYLDFVVQVVSAPTKKPETVDIAALPEWASG